MIKKDLRKENFNFNRILKDLKLSLFEPDNKDCYEQVRVSNAFDEKFIELWK